MNLKKIIRGWYHKYFKKSTYHTVHLRGALSASEQAIFETHKHLLQKGKWRKKLNEQDDTGKILEIGFGNGSHILYLSDFYKNSNAKIFAVELDKVSLFKMLTKIDKIGIQNLTLVHEDARTLVNGLSEQYFARIFVLFPDPWPKRREQKRRLLKYDFVKLLISKTKPGGEIYLATDIESYQEQIKGILETLSRENIISFEIFEELSEDSRGNNLNEYDYKKILQTKFAQKAKREGRKNQVFLVKRISE